MSYDPYAPMSGYELAVYPSQQQSDYQGEYAYGGHYDQFGAGAYEQDVIESLRSQGVLNDQQADALLEGMGRGFSAWNAAQQPHQAAYTPPPQQPFAQSTYVEPTVDWFEATAFVGGALLAGYVLAHAFARLF